LYFTENFLEMQKLIMLLFAGLFIISCKTEEKKGPVYNDIFLDNLKGNVLAVETTPYKPDSTGKVGEMDSCCVFVSEYDGKGYISKNTQKDKTGKVTTEEIFTHYDNGRMKEVVNTKEGKPAGKLIIVADSSGRYTGAERFDSVGNKQFFYTDLTQDEYGHVLTGKERKPDSSLNSSWKNTFEKQAYISGESTDSSGKVTYKSTSKVNDKGDQIESNSTEIKKDTTITKNLTYRYDAADDQGNWTQRTEMENGKPTKVEKRTITYAKKE
jgi:hypothetical protein